MFRPHEMFQIGVEYNPLDDDIGPLANVRLLKESDWFPSVSLGTSSDRIGTPDGRAGYGLLSKQLHDRLSVYGGAMYGEHNSEFVYPFGGHIHIAKAVSVALTYDGVHFHPMIGYSWKRYSLSILAAKKKDVGVAFTVGF